MALAEMLLCCDIKLCCLIWDELWSKCRWWQGAIMGIQYRKQGLELVWVNSHRRHSTAHNVLHDGIIDFLLQLLLTTICDILFEWCWLSSRAVCNYFWVPFECCVDTNGVVAAMPEPSTIGSIDLLAICSREASWSIVGNQLHFKVCPRIHCWFLGQTHVCLQPMLSMQWI